MKRVLVTGGAGFIGSHVAEALLQRGDEVLIVDDLSTGKREHVPEGATLLVADLAEPGVAGRAAVECTHVVHCAAQASVTRSVEDPVASNRANLEASTRLLLACRDSGVARLVYSSSSAVYGVVHDREAGEALPCVPLSPYGMNKLAAEHLFRMAPGLYGVDTVCLRYFNVYGPRQDPSSPYSGVISIFASRALQGRAPTIHGDGRQSRDFVYVADVVRANLAALDVPRGGGGVANIGRGVATEVLSLWDAVRRACGVPALEAVQGAARPGDIRHSLGDVRRASALLGWEARTTLEEGLIPTVAWYRAQPSGTPDAGTRPLPKESP